MRQVFENAFRSVEFARHHYRVVPEPGTTMEDLKRPEYWQHALRLLAAGDIIEVLWPENDQYAEFLVRSVTPLQGAEVFCLRHVLFDAPEHAEACAKRLTRDAFRVAFVDTKAGFRVDRISDGTTLKSGFQGKKEAWAWVDEQLASEMV